MSNPPGKKRYEKPRLAQVKLNVERNVLQGCRGEFQNVTGTDPLLCSDGVQCLKIA
jgi:hypothetical protein